MSYHQSKWTLTGSTSSYLVVWPFDEAAKDTSRHVPLVAVLSLLRHWCVWSRLTLRKIDEALGGESAVKATRRESDYEVHQLGKRIAEAVRTGRLIVVRPVPTRPSTTGASTSEPRNAGERNAVTIMVVDETGTPVPDARYRLSTPRLIREGSADAQGEARESNVDESNLTITLLKSPR